MYDLTLKHYDTHAKAFSAQYLAAVQGAAKRQ
jgi:hypothetical protein